MVLYIYNDHTKYIHLFYWWMLSVTVFNRKVQSCCRAGWLQTCSVSCSKLNLHKICYTVIVSCIERGTRLDSLHSSHSDSDASAFLFQLLAVNQTSSLVVKPIITSSCYGASRGSLLSSKLLSALIFLHFLSLHGIIHVGRH
jgi:hypothetical protein